MKLKTVIFLIILLSGAFYVIKASDSDSSDRQNNKLEVELTFENVFEDCRHTESYTSPVKETFQSLDELSSTYPSWNIKSNKNNKIVLAKMSRGYCNNHYKITLNGNKVTVTRLKNDAIYKEFYISLKYLTDEDIKELEKGKTVNSEQKLTEFIEDFTS